MRRPDWTDAEKALVRELYPKRSKWKRLRGALRKLAVELNIAPRSWNQVQQQASILGLPRPYRKYTADENAIIRKNWGRVTIRKLKTKLPGRSEGAIVRHATSPAPPRGDGLGLHRGLPQGYQPISPTTDALGYSHRALLRIYAHFEVPVRTFNMQSRATVRRLGVDSHDAAVAVARWSELETITVAARRRGVERRRVRSLLAEAKIPLPKNWHQLILEPELYDLLIDWHLERTAGESAGAAARRARVPLRHLIAALLFVHAHRLERVWYVTPDLATNALTVARAACGGVISPVFLFQVAASWPEAGPPPLPPARVRRLIELYGRSFSLEPDAPPDADIRGANRSAGAKAMKALARAWSIKP
jgi:hypothetical protein